MITEILIIIASVFALIYAWLKRHNDYWKRHNVPYIKSSWLFGSIEDVLFYRTSTGEQFRKLYNNKETENEPVVGINIFHRPALLIREPELIKCILVKDFNKFQNRFAQADAHSDTLANDNLFFLRNPAWKQMRNKLTPVFTSGKIKQMFHLIEQVGQQLNQHLETLTKASKTEIVTKELKEMCALYTTDVIASVAFGIQANSLKNPNGDFRSNGRALFKSSWWRAFVFNVIFYLPNLVSVFRCKLFNDDAAKFLRSTVDYAMAEREKSGTSRNDLIDILLALRNDSRADHLNTAGIKFEGDVLVAQAAVFFIAGFETTSSTMAFTLYELSKHQEVQKRLRDEIKKALVKNNGKLTYDIVNEMIYLNMILLEILRMYPPLAFLDRVASLSHGEDGYSLEPFSNFKVPHGMPVFVPVFAIQRDPKYFPNPDEFDPERFDPDNKNSMNPYSYMPFGLGPHNCIGERFGLLQTKIGIVNFLRNHMVLMCDKTQKNMKLDEKVFLIQAFGGITCDIKKDSLFN